jgi:hypothetical protein
LLLVIALVALAGCKSTPADAPLPVQPPAPTKPDAVQTLGKDLDKTDHRVASALVAIEKNADKPKVVVAESRLAQSYLPPPPEADVAFAVARATKADPIDYAKQMEFGRKLATAVNKAWEKLEADQKEAARVSGLKDARIKQLEEELDRVKKDKDAQWWTMAGVAVAVAGAFAAALVSPKVGATLILSAGAIGAFPHVVDLSWFKWIAGGFLAALAGLGIWVAYDAARDQVNESDSKPQPFSDDEQAPPQV